MVPFATRLLREAGLGRVHLDLIRLVRVGEVDVGAARLVDGGDPASGKVELRRVLALRCAAHLGERVRPRIGGNGERGRGGARRLTRGQVADVHRAVRSCELDLRPAPDSGPVERLARVSERSQVGEGCDLGHRRRRRGGSRTRLVVVRANDEEPRQQAGDDPDRDDGDHTDAAWTSRIDGARTSRFGS